MLNSVDKQRLKPLRKQARLGLELAELVLSAQRLQMMVLTSAVEDKARELKRLAEEK